MMAGKKLQTSRSKLQRNSKIQTPNSKKIPNFNQKGLQICENLFVRAGEWKAAEVAKLEPASGERN